MSLWLYSALFIVIGAAWWFAIFRVAGRPRTGSLAADSAWPNLFLLLVLIVWGGLGLELTLLVQPPIQNWYTRVTDFSFAEATTGTLALGFGAVLITGIVQEFLKGVPLWVGFRFIRGGHHRLGGSIWLWLTWGAALGFGFGVWEAIRIVAVPLSEYSGSMLWMALFERFWAIGFHVLSPVLMAAFLMVGRGFLGYVVAAVVHGMINYSAVLHSFWLIDMNTTEGLIAALVALLFLYTWYRLRSMRRRV